MMCTATLHRQQLSSMSQECLNTLSLFHVLLTLTCVLMAVQYCTIRLKKHTYATFRFNITTQTSELNQEKELGFNITPQTNWLN